MDDSPNVPNHDFPIPGYLIVPSGLLDKQFGTPSLLEDEDVDSMMRTAANDICEVTMQIVAPLLSAARPRCDTGIFRSIVTKKRREVVHVRILRILRIWHNI